MSDLIIQIVLQHFFDVQAVYLFGTYGTEDERPDSDLDIALLFSHKTAKKLGSLISSDLHYALEEQFKRDVDIVNLRLVNTVFQKEIIGAERRIYCADEYSADEFEMLVISYYQKLNEERADIIQQAVESGTFYNI